MTPTTSARTFIASLTVAVLIAVGLTFVFFPTLWRGGGLVGGDIYPYYYPQKQFYAEALRASEIPLWHNRTGHGYPTVGESQTGVFYPFHLLYGYLDLNTAYNVVQLLHYVVAFVGCWSLARRWGFNTLASCLAAIVFTYGWLPTRICVEWASLTAAWLPIALWCAESYLQTARRRYLLMLSFILALQMLAGHFHLAFITQLTLIAFIPLRLWLATTAVDPGLLIDRWRTAGWCVGAILCGFGLAAIQLGPTWELKQLSQRSALGDEHDPGYGYIPWWYLGQMVAPWAYYVPGLSLGETPAGASRTNTVEAHLYCGLLPLVLIVASCIRRGAPRDARNVIWWILGGAALIYSTGALMPVARYLPGFGFFNGVGRYGIVVNLAVGLLAADALQRLTRCYPWRRATGVMLTAITLTAGDCWLISRMVQHSFTVANPPLKYLDASPIRQELAAATQPVRLFCRGANLPNLLGVASTPVYLGIGPSAYFDSRFAMPQPLPFDTNPTPQQIEWLRRAGVTHILSFTPLDLAAWPVQLLVATPDPFLNRAWNRGPNESFFLYSLDGSRGRVYWLERPEESSSRITSYRAISVTIETSSKEDGTLVLTDLAWPGWQVQVDGKPAQIIANETITPYRAVRVPAGVHTVMWAYRSASLWWGSIISLATSVLLAVIAGCSLSRPTAK